MERGRAARRAAQGWGWNPRIPPPPPSAVPVPQAHQGSLLRGTGAAGVRPGVPGVSSGIGSGAERCDLGFSSVGHCLGYIPACVLLVVRRGFSRWWVVPLSGSLTAGSGCSMRERPGGKREWLRLRRLWPGWNFPRCRWPFGPLSGRAGFSTAAPLSASGRYGPGGRRVERNRVSDGAV